MICAMQTPQQIIEKTRRTLAAGVGQRSLWNKKAPLPEGSEGNGHSAPGDGKRTLYVAGVRLGEAHGLGGLGLNGGEARGGQLGPNALPVVRPKVFAGDLPFCGLFDQGAMLRRDRAALDPGRHRRLNNATALSKFLL